jgi:hypothetical protein
MPEEGQKIEIVRSKSNENKNKNKNNDNDELILLRRMVNDALRRLKKVEESQAGGNNDSVIKNIVKNMYKGSNTSYIFLLSIITNVNDLPKITNGQYLISKQINDYVNSF